MKNLFQINCVLLLGVFFGHAVGTDLVQSGCSHAHLVCHADADCEEIGETGLICKCKSGVEGDGYLNGTGCGEKTCRDNNECHINAFCNVEKRCECQQGYAGTPYIKCDDINECEIPGMCHRNAICTNLNGTFDCRCDTENFYYGNGTHCDRQCTVDTHCDITTEMCDVQANKCVCKSGFKLEDGECQNIDECEEGSDDCDENAQCTDTLGSYTCTCNNGFDGNGKTCTRLPINCDDLLKENPKARSGDHTIDPDGTENLGSVIVYCEMKDKIGTTIMKITNGRKRLRSGTLTFWYRQSVEEIKAVINSSKHCYQDVSYKCWNGAQLMNGRGYWIDGNEINQYNWGGATENNTCICGQYDMCDTEGDNCFCNGSSSTKIDGGTITNKSSMPIRGVYSDTVATGLVTVGHVICAPNTPDLPTDCHDAKYNYRIRKNGVVQIDVDGSEGELEPIWVKCDMETYKHAGVTIIDHTGPPESNGTSEYNYTVSDEHVQKLVENSAFCSQSAGYRCKNSRLLRHNGEWMGYFTDLSGIPKGHWPGGMGESNQCACGNLHRCENPTDGCNCDIKDGKWRHDFGVETDKEHLPIKSVTLNENDGDESEGKVTIGPLQCSGREFGILPTCQHYVEETDATESHPYLIDPDGPVNPKNPKDNQPPFLAYCRIEGTPMYGITIIGHENEGEFTISGSQTFTYYFANAIQLKELTTRSTECIQTVKFRCMNAPIHISGTSVLTFTSQDGNEMSYLHGDGTKQSACSCFFDDPNTCAEELKCNCDVGDGVERNDSWVFMDKDKLPVKDVAYQNIGSSVADISVGALECRVLYPNCADRVWKKHVYRLEYEYYVPNLDAVVDPDGLGPLQPFTVTCEGTRTIVPVDIDTTPISGKPGEGVTQCYTVEYSSKDGVGVVTSEQIQALVAKSKHCAQNLKKECRNAPVTGMSMFSTCAGIEQIGWAGSNGEDKCACGVTDSCAGSSGTNCSCDVVDGVKREDEGWIVQKDRLGVCQICISLDSTESLPEELSERKRWAKPSISNLFCDKDRIGTGKSCQDWRRQGETEPSTQMVYIHDGTPSETFPVFCNFKISPPIGFSETKPKDPEPPVPSNGTITIVEYYVYTWELIIRYIKQSGYCSQNVFLQCNNSSLNMTGYASTETGDFVIKWIVNEIGTTPDCVEGDCPCSLGGNQADLGVIFGQEQFPVTVINLGPAGPDEDRTLSLGSIQCFNFYRDCEDIRVHDADTNPFGNHRYVIDPDGMTGVDAFEVTCDFKTVKKMGITKVDVVKPADRTVRNQTEPYQQVVDVEYEGATPEQIKALAQISGFCLQGIQYRCKNSPITDASSYSTYGNGVSPNFGAADYSDATACACDVLHTCPEGKKCHCDAAGNVRIENGYEMDVPFEELRFGGQGENSYAMYDITGIGCAPRPFDLPKDCQDVYERGNDLSSEYLIWPDENVAPYLVYCDMDILPGKGVVVIKTDIDKGVSVTYDEKIDVTYRGIKYLEQLKTLVEISSYCYQPVKYICKNTKLIRGDHFWWKGGQNGDELKYFASGREYAQECECGKINKCGGSEDKLTLINENRTFGETDRIFTKSPYSVNLNAATVRYLMLYSYVNANKLSEIKQRKKKQQKRSIKNQNRSDSDLKLDDGQDIFLSQVLDEIESMQEDDIVLSQALDLFENKESFDLSDSQFKNLVEDCTSADFFGSFTLKLPTGENCELLGVDTRENRFGKTTKTEDFDALIKDQKSGNTERSTKWATSVFEAWRSVRKLDGEEIPPLEECDINTHLSRRCNCDAADNQTRADAGIFQIKDHLAVWEMMFKHPGTSNPSGELILGPLYCSQEELDLDECKMGFHDCHKHAECIKLEDTYDCMCKEGWQAIGRPEKWANGRNCYDDNECAEGVNKCPPYADCTNTEGSYNCTCQQGFRPKPNAKKKCVDINECVEGTHNCDENAKCYNKPGSYVCRCNRNYRGDGFSCRALAKCEVFGDPHIHTYDQNLYHYQGQCDYIVSRDNCNDLNIAPTFEVTANFYKKYEDFEDASWVKNVTATIGNNKFEFHPDKVLVNGLQENSGLNHEDFKLYAIGENRFELVTNIGIEVKYDGDGVLQVFVPGDFANTTCGLCGDYNGNPDDDLVVGPGCNETKGTVTDNVALFAQSWTDPSNQVCAANCSATNPPDPCTDEEKAFAKQQCQRIYGRHRHFQECLNNIDPEMKDKYHASCVYDVCRAEGDVEEALCAHAKYLLAECSSLTSVEVKSFRTEDFCAIDCGLTMDYKECVRQPPLTCTNYLQQTTQATTEDTECREGCFCKPGYYLSGDECVLPGDCGCMKDDKYYKKGEEITSTGCQEKITCEGNNSFTDVETITCHQNATCTVKNGIFGCHCNDPLYGDGIISCVPDPCEPESPCGVNETCIRNLQTENNYECVCKMGFIGDCGNCKEIDECNTIGLDACPPDSKCVNEIGSHRCECNRGFVKSGKICQDIDECALARLRNITLCGENSKCVDKKGRHECRCCSGYKEKNGTCVKSSSWEDVNDVKCCICIGGKCNEDKKICGTDHENYDNYKDMVVRTCEEGRSGVQVDYYGKCKQKCPTGTEICPKYQECNDEEGTQPPTCECKECDPEDIESDKVCATNGIIYVNKCIFKKIQCQFDAEAELEVNVQVCEDKNGDLHTGPWTPWSECNVTCGKGTMTRSREGYITQEFQQKYPLVAHADCYEDPCPGSPCENHTATCKAKSAECIVNDKGEAECECPTCKDIGVEKVCGYIIHPDEEPVPTTYPSACQLQRKACQQKRDHEVYKYGPCDEKPLTCNRVPNVDYIFDEQYRSKMKVDVAKCEGGCGQDLDFCCQPSMTTKKIITMENNSTNPSLTKTQEVTIIKDCECEELLP